MAEAGGPWQVRSGTEVRVSIAEAGLQYTCAAAASEALAKRVLR